MNYHINEGQFTLPFQYEDNSINIFKFPQRQASLVITRALLKKQQTADDYFDDQVAVLTQSMKNFIIDEREPATLGSEPPLAGFETHCEFEQNGLKMHQMLLIIPVEQRLLVFTYSQPRAFSAADLQHWQSFKATFIPQMKSHESS